MTIRSAYPLAVAALLGAVVGREVLRLRRIEQMARALSEYLPIRYYHGSENVSGFYSCQVCNEQTDGPTRQGMEFRHYAECPWVLFRAALERRG